MEEGEERQESSKTEKSQKMNLEREENQKELSAGHLASELKSVSSAS